MALTGFDPGQVKTSIGKVKKAYGDLIEQIGTNMQKQFVNGMQDKWACEQAVTFFKDTFKPVVDKLNKNADSTFESVVNAMDSAATNWAKQMDASYTKAGFTKKNITMSVDCIKNQIKNVKGIDVATAGTVAAKLPTINTNASTALSDAKSAVKNCGFVGGDQEASLIGALEKIRKAIDADVTKLTNDVKTAIKDTVTAYSDLEGKVSKAFQGE